MTYAADLPSMPTRNLAPAKPILALAQRRETGAYLADGLKELIHDMLERDRPLFDEVARTTEIVSNFIQGKQVWDRSYWSDQWRIVQSNRADPNRVTSINIMQFYCTTQLKMFTSSNPDLEPADEYKQREYREKVKIAKAVWNCYESRFYTPRFNQQEALHAIISGTYIESVRYDQLKQGAKLFKEVLETKRVRVDPGYSKCFSCGHEGAAEPFMQGGDGQPIIPSCPECGSTEILPPRPPVDQEFSSVEGYDPVQIGDLELRLIPVQATRFDPRVPIEESSWAIERIQIEEDKLRYFLGDLDASFSDNSSDQGLQSLDAITRAGNTVSGLGPQQFSRPYRKMAIVDRVSIMPEDVCHIKISEDTPTLSGETIPKNTVFSDLIPAEGATILAANDGGLILGIYPGVHHSREMSSGTYHMRLQSGLGRGSEDTVEVQKRFNRNDSQITKYGEASATPARTYIAGSVKRAHIRKIGHPQAVIPIEKSVAIALKSTRVIDTLAPGTIGAQFFQYTYDILNQYRQLTSHSTDFTNAFPGVNNTTATGAKLAKSNADSVFSPALTLKGHVRVGTAQNTLALRAGPQFQGLKQWFMLGKTSGDRAIGRHVGTGEIDPSIEFTVVRDSEQPKTMYDRQVDFVNMMNVASQGGGYTALKQQDPQLTEALRKAFDIDLDDDTYDMLVDVCEERLEQALMLQASFQIFSQAMAMRGMQPPQLPPEAALHGINPSIEVEEPDHMQKCKWFMQYLDTPDGRGMTNDQREIVRMFVRIHAQLEAQQQALINQLASSAQVAGAQPMMDAQNQMADAQAQRDQAAQDQQNTQDQVNAQLDHNRQQGAQAQSDIRQHAMSMAQARQAHFHDQMAAHNDAQRQAAQAVLESGLRQYEAENAPAPAGGG